MMMLSYWAFCRVFVNVLRTIGRTPSMLTQVAQVLVVDVEVAQAG